MLTHHTVLMEQAKRAAAEAAWEQSRQRRCDGSIMASFQAMPNPLKNRT